MWTYPPATILVPVDFGEASRRAVEMAPALAARYHARLVLLHAETFEAPAYFTHQQVAVIERERMAAKNIARRHVAEFARLSSLPFSVQVVQAPAAEAILDAASKADLIVMGTHGRRGPSRWWLGSVAERVARDANVPVLVVRSPAGPAEPEAAFVRPMIVAGPHTLDGAASRYASGLGEAFGGQVAERTATCEADLAKEREASLMVVAKPSEGSGWFAESVERMLRSCSLPMLFVPGNQ